MSSIAQLTSKHLIWIDIEATGLDFKTDRILEIAVHITNNSLEIVDEGLSLVITQSEASLQNMDRWNTKHHTDSGLVDEVRRSSLTVPEAEKKVLSHISDHIPDPSTSPICGNSICYDRMLMAKYMPELTASLYYRSIDVTTLKELILKWRPDIEKFNKEEKHRALPDIRESIAELRYYKERLFHV